MSGIEAISGARLGLLRLCQTVGNFRWHGECVHQKRVNKFTAGIDVISGRCNDIVRAIIADAPNFVGPFCNSVRNTICLGHRFYALLQSSSLVWGQNLESGFKRLPVKHRGAIQFAPAVARFRLGIYPGDFGRCTFWRDRPIFFGNLLYHPPARPRHDIDVTLRRISPEPSTQEIACALPQGLNARLLAGRADRECMHGEFRLDVKVLHLKCDERCAPRADLGQYWHGWGAASIGVAMLLRSCLMRKLPGGRVHNLASAA